FADGLMYTGTGRVFDPETRQLKGTFANIPQPALVLPDPAAGRVFFLTEPGYQGPRQLLAFDRRTFLPAGSLDIPGVTGEAYGLVAWGAAGFAFRTDENQVVILRTRLRPPAVVAADLSLVGSVSPNPVAPGANVTYILTVTNHGPDMTSGVTLRDTL